jgi:hypothetical protein
MFNTEKFSKSVRKIESDKRKKLKYVYRKKDCLDRFYTTDIIAKKCVEYLDLKQYDKIIEPSAGSGAFVRALDNKCEAYDIDPEVPWEIKDFLTSWYFGDKILIVGNPPFGKQSSLAIKFINHAANFADTIAFILPNSFSKESIIKKLNYSLIIEQVIELPKNSFLLNGEKYDVPCSFYIFKKLKNGSRPLPQKETTYLFNFINKEQGPDFSVRRVGVYAGKPSLNIDCSKSSNYFIKSNIKKEILFDLFKIPFKEIKYSVGPASLSKNEIIREINKRYNTTS